MYLNFSRESNEILDRSRARLDGRVMKGRSVYDDREILEIAQSRLRSQMADFLVRERADVNETEFEFELRLDLLVLTPDQLATIIRNEAVRLYSPPVTFEPGPVKAND